MAEKEVQSTAKKNCSSRGPKVKGKKEEHVALASEQDVECIISGSMMLRKP